MTTIYFSKVNSEEIDTEEPFFNPLSKHKISLFGNPIEVGHFSIDANKEINFDRSQMKYLITNLQTEHLNLDLNADSNSNLMHQYVTIHKLYQLLHWIVHQKFSLLKPKMDFVTVRGTLSRIMCTPYMKGHYRNTWVICASKFNGIIYMSAVDTDVDYLESLSPQLMQYQSWGYKFEQYLTTAHINKKPELKPFNNHEEFCIVLKNQFNQFSLLYQAEIDAVAPRYIPTPGSGDTSRYVELKTSQILSRPTDEFKFRSHKLATWWAQSYLTGISDIICGRRTREGIVKFLDFYNVKSIPMEACDLWSSEACLNFCDKFLKLVKKNVTEDNPNIVFKFTYNGEGTIHSRKLVKPEAKYKIIPEWYQNAMYEYGQMQ